MSVICFVSLVHVIWGFGSILLCVMICFGLLIFTIFSLFLEMKWMFFVKAEFLFLSFARGWLHARYWCLVPGSWKWPSCLWKEELQQACLIRRKGSLLGLVTPQKPMVTFPVPCMLMYVATYRTGWEGIFLDGLWSCGHVCLYVCVYICMCVCVFVREWNSVSQPLPCHPFV